MCQWHFALDLVYLLFRYLKHIPQNLAKIEELDFRPLSVLKLQLLFILWFWLRHPARLHTVTDGVAIVLHWLTSCDFFSLLVNSSY